VSVVKLLFGVLYVLFAALNPKNLALTIAAAAPIAQAGISTGEEIATIMTVLLLVLGAKLLGGGIAGVS
jgi:hypothetical protein